MEPITIVLLVGIAILGSIVIGLLLVSLRKSSSINNDQKFTESITQIVNEKINTSFTESVKNLTNLANDKLETTQKAANNDLENKKKLIDLRIEGISKTLDDVQKTLKKYDIDSTTRLTQLTSDIKNISTQTIYG